MKTKPDYILLIHKQLTDQISHEEEAVLEEWLNKSEENKQFAEDVRLSWELTDVEDPEINEELLEEERQRLMQRISQMDDEGFWRISHYRKYSFFKYSAIILLLVLAAWATYHFSQADHQRIEGMASTTFKISNELQEVLLPDSSLVFLNGNADLSFGQSGQAREVHLSGQAFFEVARDEQRPFYIHAGKASIKVLGTSFLVKAVPGETLEVSVESGKVEVQHQEYRFQLGKGEQLLMSPAGEPRLQLNEDPNYLSWKENKLVFRHTPLAKVLPTLERHYGVSIQVENPDMLSCSFTGTFEDATLEDLLKIMSYSLHTSAEWFGDRKLRISGEGCIIE